MWRFVLSGQYNVRDAASYTRQIDTEHQWEIAFGELNGRPPIIWGGGAYDNRIKCPKYVAVSQHLLSFLVVVCNERVQHWLAWREMIRPQAARRAQCAVKWDRNLKPK